MGQARQTVTVNQLSTNKTVISIPIVTVTMMCTIPYNIFYKGSKEQDGAFHVMPYMSHIAPHA